MKFGRWIFIMFSNLSAIRALLHMAGVCFNLFLRGSMAFAEHEVPYSSEAHCYKSLEIRYINRFDGLFYT